MSDSSTASSPQTVVARRPKTAAERQRAFRQRQREKLQLGHTAVLPPASSHNVPNLQSGNSGFVTPVASIAAATPAAKEILPSASLTEDVTSRSSADVTVSRRHVTVRRSIGSYCLSMAALALAGVGLVMNGWFAHTLGSTSLAGWTFLAIGAANDVVALTVPAAAAKLWQGRQRLTAIVAWLVWSASFLFAFISALGFASVNIADTALTRASRVTPAVTIAQDALRDAVTSRNRECAGGVGRFCRDRELVVVERQRALDSAVGSVERASDPQTEAASKIVAWLSAGNANPTAADFAMLRLLLISLLPQVGGLLLMISRTR